MDSDFTITTTATISQMPVDKQYAFGLAVMAKVGTHEKTSQPSQDEQGVTLVGGYDSTAKTAESSSLANVMIKITKEEETEHIHLRLMTIVQIIQYQVRKQILKP